MAKSPTKTGTQLQTQIHHGRRAKLRARLLANGLDSFNEYEVLELALGLVIPRVDTNPAAHDLINKFGSLRAVMEATPEAIASAYGIGEQAAFFLQFLHQFTGYLAKQTIKRVKITSPQTAINYLQPLMQTYTVEQLVAVCLDPADNVRSIQAFTNQELDKIYVNIRELLRLVLQTKAAKLLIAHNHLNESPLPSVADMGLTRQLLTACDNLGITLLDHVIFAGQACYSFKKSGLLDLFSTESKHK